MPGEGPSWWQRLAQSIAFTRPGAWLFSRTLHVVDLKLMRLTGGRVSFPRALGGVPVLRLTTTGAKTGKDRTVPVMGIPNGEEWILVASNWGRERHPAWFHNLKANPEVTVTHHDETGAYVAREATDDERDEYWDLTKEIYPGFERWTDRTGDREIPIVVLEPA